MAVEHGRPPVSVIMPVHNAGEFLADAARSVIAQLQEGDELLVIDDASTDASREILELIYKKHPGIRHWRNDSNQGISRCLNFLLTKSRNEFVAIAEQDDVSLPGRLARQSSFLARFPEVIVVGASAYYIGTKGMRFGKAKAGFGSKEDFDRRAKGHVIHLISPTVMMRKSSALHLGGFDPRFDGCQDDHLWNRLAEFGYVVSLDDFLLEYRLHTRSTSIRSSTRQAFFPAYWRYHSTSAADGVAPNEDLDSFIQRIRRERPFMHARLRLMGHGYKMTRMAGAHLSDRNYLTGVGLLVPALLLNPRLVLKHVKRICPAILLRQ